MDKIYENATFLHSTAEPIGKSKGLSEATPCKRTKVLLIVLCVCGVLAVAGLCVLGIMYYNKCADFESLTIKHDMILMQLSVQELNNTKKFEQLASRFKRLRDWLSFHHENWTTCQEKMYFFSSNKQSWSNSRDVCLSKGADLVTITNKVEQMLLESKIKETHWIGLNDLETEGRWVWVNNQTLEETRVQFWYTRESGENEPDNWKVKDPSGENCASMGDMNRILDAWFDHSCQSQKRFICEKRSSSPFTNDDH